MYIKCSFVMQLILVLPLFALFVLLGHIHQLLFFFWGGEGGEAKAPLALWLLHLSL